MRESDESSFKPSLLVPNRRCWRQSECGRREGEQDGWLEAEGEDPVLSGWAGKPQSFSFFSLSLSLSLPLSLSLSLKHTQTHTYTHFFSDRLSSYSVGNARNFCVTIRKKKSLFPLFSSETQKTCHQYYCHSSSPKPLHTMLPLTTNDLMDYITLWIMCFVLLKPRVVNVQQQNINILQPSINNPTKQTPCL